MDFLGIGPLEVLLILVLVLVIFGPKEIDKTGKAIGKGLNRLVHSDAWRSINQTSRELKNLPTRLMKEAGLEELEKEAKQVLSTSDQTIRPPAQTLSSSATDSQTPNSKDDGPENPPEKAPSE